MIVTVKVTENSAVVRLIINHANTMNDRLGPPDTTHHPMSNPLKTESKGASIGVALAALAKTHRIALRMLGPTLIGLGYVTGYLYCDFYFQHYHLTSGPFPKTVPEYIYYGGQAIFLDVSALFEIKASVTQMILAILIVSIGIGAYVGVFSFAIEKLAGRVKDNEAKSKKDSLLGIKQFFGRWPAARMSIKSAGITFLVIYGIGVALFFTLMLCVIPLSVAALAADKQYALDRKGFANGCTDPKAEMFCFEVKDGDKQIARGFIVAISGDYVALDEDGITHLVSLQQRELTQLEMPLKH